MKFTTSTLLTTLLTTLAAASPINTAPYQYSSSLPGVYPTGTAYYYPTASASGYGIYPRAPYPTGTSVAAPYPTGTGVLPPYPSTTGTSSCPSNGALVCSPDGSEFGVCNWGKVIWQGVADGTECVDGKIVKA